MNRNGSFSFTIRELGAKLSAQIGRPIVGITGENLITEPFEATPKDLSTALDLIVRESHDPKGGKPRFLVIKNDPKNLELLAKGVTAAAEEIADGHGPDAVDCAYNYVLASLATKIDRGLRQPGPRFEPKYVMWRAERLDARLKAVTNEAQLALIVADARTIQADAVALKGPVLGYLPTTMHQYLFPKALSKSGNGDGGRHPDLWPVVNRELLRRGSADGNAFRTDAEFDAIIAEMEPKLIERDRARRVFEDGVAAMFRGIGLKPEVKVTVDYRSEDLLWVPDAGGMKHLHLVVEQTRLADCLHIEVVGYDVRTEHGMADFARRSLLATLGVPTKQIEEMAAR